MNKINITKNKGKKKTTYTARIQINGVRRNITRSSKKEVEKAVKEMFYQVENGIVAVEEKPKEKITLNQWFEIWIREYKELTVKESSVESYKRWYLNHIYPKLGTLCLQDINAERLQRYFNELIRKANLSSSSVQYIKVIMNDILEQAFINEHIVKNPCKQVKKIKKDKPKEKNLLSLENEKQFLRYFKNETYKNVCIVALYTGMRVNEILGLTWENIDFDKKLIHVRHSLYYKNKQNYKLTPPKSSSSVRDIPMLSNVCELLQELKKDRSKGFVFQTKDNKPIDYTSINRRIGVIVERMNKDGILVEHMTMHCFRHTFATRCIKQGMTPQTLKTIMGHSTLAITMDLYAHVEIDTKQLEMLKLENII